MKKKTYADLFKPQKNMALTVDEQESVHLSVSEIGSGSSLGASCSSGLSTPFGSELGSSGSEDEEFMAELSRQMAECMLNEEEEDSNTDCTSVCEGFEVYQLKNQTQESGVGESRVKGNKRVPNTGRDFVNYKRKGHGMVGSGMKAIFLDNSGSSYGAGGTGVFLPRCPNDPTREKKKPVCSVLMPVRVLQTLELHFSRLSDTSSPVSRGSTSPRCIGHDTPNWTHPRSQRRRNGSHHSPQSQCCHQFWQHWTQHQQQQRHHLIHSNHPQFLRTHHHHVLLSQIQIQKRNYQRGLGDCPQILRSSHHQVHHHQK
ncbi:uncharacterized protein LOC142504360 [Primulina tabacum]|uniref:uncharacterized protein LOC142504360 n=1 Tax=Primulina tabacum TaxID=48773 RepID=UPI003F5958CD